MSTGTTLTKPSLRLRTMTVSSTSGIQRLIHLHRNLRNQTFTKLMNCCTHRNKHQGRISRNIQFSAVSSSQKKRWICQLPLVRLNECCFVYTTYCVVARSNSIFCLFITCTNNYHIHITYLLTPWSRVLLGKLTGFAASQEITRIFWNPKVHYRTHKYPPPVPSRRSISPCENFLTWLFTGRVVSTAPNPQAGGPPLVGCLRLLIQFNRSYPPYWRPFLHPQPEDAPCCGDGPT
jgi:hypothetical protein